MLPGMTRRLFLFHIQLFIANAVRLFVLHHVDPVHQELPFFGLALYGLGSRNDGQPLLHILLSSIGLLAEQVQILLSSLDVAGQPEQQVGPGGVSAGVALGGIKPSPGWSSSGRRG